MRSYCVLLRTHYWDDQLAARFRPLSDALGPRFIVAVDESTGPVDVGGLNKLSVTRDTVEQLGLLATDDYGWRCGDYNFYAARQAFPDFDDYWLIENDVLLHFADPSVFLNRLAARECDMLAPYLRPAQDRWGWTQRMANFAAPVMSCAFPIMRLSGAVIDALHSERVRIGTLFRDSGKADSYWPNDESFTATTAVKLGFDCKSLSNMRGDVFKDGFSTAKPISITDPRFQGDYSAQVYHPVLGGEALAAKIIRYVRTLPSLDGHRPRIDELLDQLAPQIPADRMAHVRDIYAARLHADRASTLRGDGDMAGAVDQYRQAYVLDPDWEYHQPLIANLIRAGQPKEAMTICEDVIAKGQDRAAVHFHYGSAARADGDTVLALDRFRTATELAPWSANYWRAYLRALRAVGDYTAYDQALQSALVHHPDFSEDRHLDVCTMGALRRLSDTHALTGHILLCATQRCGSTMVMEDMRNSGVLGKPEEFFINWRKDADIRLVPRLSKLYQTGTSDNHIFSAKMMADQLVRTEELLSLQVFDDIKGADYRFFRALFDGWTFVRITRRNVIRQAISRLMARKTGINHATGSKDDAHFAGNLMKGYSADYNAGAEYDGDAIHQIVEDITGENARWDRLFADWGKSPVQIVYEDYVQDSAAGIHAIAAAAGAGLPVEMPTRKMVKLSNARNDAWYQQYLSDYGAEDLDG